MAEIDVAVIGGGAVGLAIAAEIAGRGRSVCVLERHPRPGMETSTHNSGVVHAGLYHPTNSLKTRLAREGRERLYRFCEEHHVPFRRTGKLVVAEETQRAQLEALQRQALENGAGGVRLIGRDEIRALEPAVDAAAALYSPETGIVEAESFVRALQRVCGDRDVAMLVGSPLVGAEIVDAGIALRTPHERLVAESVVNAAGLYADAVSSMLGGDAFRIYPCRGEYAELAPRHRAVVSRPVYPLPHPSGHGLGVHLTPTTGGSILIGPTIRYQADKTDYEADRLPLDAFVDPVRRLLPWATLDDLRAGGSGIRAKLHPPEQSFADFLIARDSRHPHVVHAAGIDSPGLTAALAIARYAADLVEGRP